MLHFFRIVDASTTLGLSHEYSLFLFLIDFFHRVIPNVPVSSHSPMRAPDYKEILHRHCHQRTEAQASQARQFPSRFKLVPKTLFA